MSLTPANSLTPQTRPHASTRHSQAKRPYTSSQDSLMSEQLPGICMSDKTRRQLSWLVSARKRAAPATKTDHAASIRVQSAMDAHESEREASCGVLGGDSPCCVRGSRVLRDRANWRRWRVR